MPRGGRDSKSHLNEEKQVHKRGAASWNQFHHKNPNPAPGCWWEEGYRAGLGWKTRKRERAAPAVRDHDWKEKNQAEEDTRKGKRHLHSKKQMVQNDRQVLARHVRHPG